MLRIVVCGVGALGSTCVQLLRNIDAELRLVDFDRVETKNLQAQWFVKQSLGKLKAEAVRLQLANFYGVKAEAMSVRLVAQNAPQLLAGAGLAVDCFDNADSRLVLKAACLAAGIPLVHAGVAADGTVGIVRWTERFTPDREDVPGEPTCEGGEHLPMFALVAAALARTIQDFVARDVRYDYLVIPTAVTRTS